MKTKTRVRVSAFRFSDAAFTLIELLVVISIIAILAAMLVPVLGRAKVKAQINQAKVEISQIVTAIHGYESENNKFPVSTNAMLQASRNKDDFTYGTDFLQTNTPSYTPSPNPYSSYVGRLDNSEVMAVLLDKETYPIDGTHTINYGHVKNPKKYGYLVAKMVGDTKSPGVGADLIYRDPWGNPYIITLDLNYDDKARDVFYRQQNVSKSNPVSQSGVNGLSNSTDSSGAGDHYECSSPIMVWSAGPDRKFDAMLGANVGVNKDNVLSWK